MSGLDLRDLIGESETEEENENEEENPLPVSVEPMTIVNNPESKQPDNNSNGICFIDTFTFLGQFKNKIENCVVTDLSLPNIPDGKYLLFMTNEKEDAHLYLIENPAKLHFEYFEPDRILVEHSGIIATSSKFRTYVGKTNVVQFTLHDGIPIKMSVIKKSNDSKDARVKVIEKEENNMSVEELKLHIRKVSPRLEKLTNEMTDKNEIKDAIIAFLDDVKDINHLIKINSEIMMIAF